MMKQFIQDLATRRVGLSVADDRLRVTAAKGILSAGDQQTLQANADDIKMLIRSGFGTSVFLATGEQSRIWAMSKVAKEQSFFTLALAALVEGDCTITRLNASLQGILLQYPILQCRFVESGGDLQLLRDAATELSVLPIVKEEGQSRDAAITAFLQKPFGLEQGPLFRVGRLEEKGSTVLVTALHHIIGDMASLHILTGELLRLYQGGSVLPAEPIFLPAQRSTETDLAYWKGAMKQTKPFTAWRSAASQPINFSAQNQYRLIPEKIAGQLFGASRKLSVTPTVLLLTALQKALQLATAASDFIIGVPVDLRSDFSKEGAVGFFSKPLAVRDAVSATNTVSAGVQAVHASLVHAVAHRHISTSDLGKIISASGKRDRSIPPFQVLFNFLNLDAGDSAPYTLLEVNRGATDLDLFVNFILSENVLRVSVEYREQFFSAESISRFTEGLVNLLETISADASEWPLPELLTAQPLRIAPPEPVLALVGSFTCDPIVGMLEAWSQKLGYRTEYCQEGYGQLLQSLLRPDSALLRKGNWANILLLRPADLIPFDSLEARELDGAIDAFCAEFVGNLKRAAAATGDPYFVGFCPADSNASGSGDPVADLCLRAERLIIEALEGSSTVYCIASNEWSQLYPVPEIFDAVQDQLGHIPYTEDFFLAMATLLTRRIMRVRQPIVKVVVADCDNTLWKGIIGEDGVENIVLTEGHLALQEKLQALALSGVLVCLCSKNDEAAIDEYFATRTDSVLKREHIVARRINWEPKSVNIRSLAAELNLGLDAFVFLDDNEVECAEVRAHCPEVLTIQVPHSDGDFAAYIENLWLLDVLKVAAPDSDRTQQYLMNAQRKEMQGQFSDYAAFLDSLQIRIDFAPLDKDNLARAAQLALRTNQFNATTHRRTEPELENLSKAGCSIFLVSVTDRFGAYGIVGMMILEEMQEHIRVETFLLSCRVLGKGVEQEMLRFAGRFANERNKDRVVFEYLQTPKNTPVFSFLNKLGARPEAGAAGLQYFKLTTAAAAEFSVQPGSEEVGPALTPATAVNEAAANFQLIESIAQTGSDIEKIDAFLFGGRPEHEPENGELVSVLRGFWQEILGHSDFTATDDFFAVGGDSIGLVRLIARVRKQFGLDLPIDHFVVTCTISELCRCVAPTSANANAAAVLHPSDDLVLELPELQTLPQKEMEAYAHVLLTGATGFLGAFLLRDLMRHSDATIHCLVRAESENAGLERVRENMEHYGLWSPAMVPRLRIVPADLVKERFGCDPETWLSLAEMIECVLHNASDVSFSKSYSEIRKVNVLPVKTLLEFCGTSQRKYLHYVSTAGVFSGAPFHRDSRITDGAPAADVDTLVSGYLKSKWVAEGLLRQAQAKGYSIAIYRPGNISGDGQLGRTNRDNFFLKFTQAIIADGEVPDNVHSVNLVPVDFVSKCIARLSLKTRLPSGDYNLVNPRPLALSRFVSLMKLSGYPLEVVGRDKWTDSIAAKAEAGGHPLLPLIPLLAVSRSERSLLDAVFAIPRLSLLSVYEQLGDDELGCPPVDMDLMRTYFNFFDEQQLLETSQQTEERRFLYFREKMYGFGIGGAADPGTGFRRGMLQGMRLELDSQCRVRSLTHLVKDRKVLVSGYLTCDWLSDDPLSIESGYWEIRPLQGVLAETPEKQVLIEHQYTLIATDGRRFHFHGRKVTGPGFALMKEAITLYATIREQDAFGAIVLTGMMEVDLSEFLQDQVFGVKADKRLSREDATIAKGLWLSFLFGNILGQGVENNLRYIAGQFLGDSRLVDRLTQVFTSKKEIE
jgi:thioester reductase-like protein/FkbH-like protein